MEQKNLEKINELVNRWGVPLQLILTMEESAELTKTCSKLLRGFVQRETLVDSLADSYIMLQTLCMIYNVTPEELDAVATKKLDVGLSKPGWESFGKEEDVANKEEVKEVKEEKEEKEEKKE